MDVFWRIPHLIGLWAGLAPAVSLFFSGERWEVFGRTFGWAELVVRGFGGGCLEAFRLTLGQAFVGLSSFGIFLWWMFGSIRGRADLWAGLVFVVGFWWWMFGSTPLHHASGRQLVGVCSSRIVVVNVWARSTSC